MSVVIAQARFESSLQRGDVFRFPVSLENPDLYQMPWSVDGILVDREILSFDSEGFPRVVLVTGSKIQNSMNANLKAERFATTVEQPLSLMPTIALSLIVGGAQYRCALADAALLRLEKKNFYERGLYFAQFIKVGAAEKLMGVHFYTERTKDHFEVRVRIHNGVYENHNGPVFYDSLSITCDGHLETMAESMGETMKHLFRPQEQVMVTWGYGRKPRQGKILRANGYLASGGFGAEQERLPYYMPEYGTQHDGEAAAESKVKWDLSQMQTALMSGVADPDVFLYTNRMGPFMPISLGDSGAGAPGGWGISTVATRTQSEAEIELLKLQQECTNARTPRALYDQNGAPKSAHDFKTTDGKLPFYFNTIGGWKPEKNYLEQNDTLPQFKGTYNHPYNTGFCPYLGTKWSGGMAGFEGYDDAHYSRGLRYAKSLYYLTGDWSAKADLLAMAEWAHFSWIEFATTDSYYDEHGHSVFNQLRAIGDAKHKQGWLERSFGWTCDSMAQAYAIANREWRLKFKPWFVEAEKLIDASTMPTGLTQREPVGSHLHQTAVTANPPFPSIGYDVAGAIYIGICCQGFQAINKAVFGNKSEVIRNYLSKVIDFCFSQPLYGAAGPAYYMSPARSGGEEPFTSVTQSVFGGGLEGYNFWWSCIHTYRATGNRRYFELLRRYAFEKPTHMEKVQQLFTNANSWDDKLSEAAYYIAEVERKMQTEGPV